RRWAAVSAPTRGGRARAPRAARGVGAGRAPRPGGGRRPAAPAVGLVAMAATGTPAGALLVLTRGLLDGLWQPLLNVYMNRLVESRLRATMLSAQSLVARLALAAAIAPPARRTPAPRLLAELG